MNATATATSLAAIATAFAGAFETRKRDQSGEEYHVLKDGSPEWMRDVCRAAHDGGEMLPDDWRYRMIRECADAIAERLADDEDVDLYDSVEAVDSLVPVYHAQRTGWLASNLARLSYCDDAADEMGCACNSPNAPSLSDRIAWGMFAEYTEVWNAIARALEEQAD